VSVIPPLSPSSAPVGRMVSYLLAGQHLRGHVGARPALRLQKLLGRRTHRGQSEICHLQEGREGGREGVRFSQSGLSKKVNHTEEVRVK
jgi:hypothetical protein